MSSALIAEELD